MLLLEPLLERSSRFSLSGGLLREVRTSTFYLLYSNDMSKNVKKSDSPALSCREMFAAVVTDLLFSIAKSNFGAYNFGLLSTLKLKYQIKVKEELSKKTNSDPGQEDNKNHHCAAHFSRPPFSTERAFRTLWWRVRKQALYSVLLGTFRDAPQYRSTGDFPMILFY